MLKTETKTYQTQQVLKYFHKKSNGRKNLRPLPTNFYPVSFL